MTIELTTILAGEEEPMQPVGVDAHGVHRFLENRIVRDLLDFAQPRGYGLNEIACGHYSPAEHRQVAQLIGYSVDGYGTLSYVNDESYERAHERSEALLEDDSKPK
ncbi:hypothetical protein D3C73_173140 [compost metagenome]|jgi:hypothetical protein